MSANSGKTYFGTLLSLAVIAICGISLIPILLLLVEMISILRWRPFWPTVSESISFAFFGYLLAACMIASTVAYRALEGRYEKVWLLLLVVNSSFYSGLSPSPIAAWAMWKHGIGLGSYNAEIELYVYRDGGRFGLRSGTSERLTEPIFDRIGEFAGERKLYTDSSLIDVEYGGQVNCIDRRGELVLKKPVDELIEGCSILSYGLNAQRNIARRGAKYGFVDLFGEATVDFKFDELGHRSQIPERMQISRWRAPSYARLWSDWTQRNGYLTNARLVDKWGYIDDTGDFAIKPDWLQAKEFDAGSHFFQTRSSANVRSSEGWGVIDASGSEIVPSRFGDVTNVSNLNSDPYLFCVKETESRWMNPTDDWGLYDASLQRLVLPMRYSWKLQFLPIRRYRTEFSKDGYLAFPGWIVASDWRRCAKEIEKVGIRFSENESPEISEQLMEQFLNDRKSYDENCLSETNGR